MVKENVHFPKTWEELVVLLNNSTYLQNLLTNDLEQSFKNNTTFYTISDLQKFYASCSQYATLEDKTAIKKAVAYLYESYPSLPSSDFSFVVVNPKTNLEMGSTSFTINNVAFLHHNAVRHPETIMHEAVHIIQRSHPHWFSQCCQYLGYQKCNFKGDKSLISNPDAEISFKDSGNELIAYNSYLEPVVVNTITSHHTPLKDHQCQKKQFLGVNMHRDSISEMMAVRFTKYIEDSSLRKHVNNFLSCISK